MKHLLFFLLLISTTLHSQTRYPFGSKHKNIKTITLTNGKYDEFFDEDTLQRVGSSVININTRKITKIKLSQEEIDELENAQDGLVSTPNFHEVQSILLTLNHSITL
jgi:hypothetical protein